MAGTMTWQTSTFRRRPLFVLLVMLSGWTAAWAQAGALTATEMVRGPLPAALTLIGSSASPVYTPDELLMEYVGAEPAFVVTIGAGGGAERVVPLEGMSFLWPAMVKALRDEVFDAQYVGKTVLVTMVKPVDPLAAEPPALVLHRHEEQKEPGLDRIVKRQMPCDTAMSAVQLIRQGRKLGAFPEDERHCYDLALEKDSKSVPGLWAAMLAAAPHSARMEWYDTMLRLRPDFYEVQMRHWAALQERGASATVLKYSAPEEGAPVAIQLEVLAAMEKDARTEGRFEEDLALRDRLAGLRLRAVSMRPEKPTRYAVAMEMYELGLRLDGAGRAKDAVGVLRVAAGLSEGETEFFGAYSLLRLRLALAHALVGAGDAAGASAICRDVAAGAVSSKEIETEGLGSRAVVEGRREIFCGEAAVGTALLKKEAAGHPEYVEIHRVLGDFAAAAGDFARAEKELGMWGSKVPVGNE